MRSKFLGAVSAVVLSLTPYGVSAQAEEASQKIDISAQSLQGALLKFSEQTDIVVVAPSALVKNKTAPKVVGNLPPYQALSRLLVGSGLKYARGADGEITIVSSADQIGIAANASSTQLAMYQNSEQQNDATSNAQDQAVRQNGNSQEEEDLMELPEILVTGSHIRGAGPVGSKVFTYDRSEIDLQGYATLPDFMRSLPQNFNGGFSEITAASFGGTSDAARGNLVSGSGVNLRGLGNTSTLILLDGQRLSPAGSDGSFVDISMIPLAAIETVEILTDGASATYGSDAVGGVVNYKVRKDYDGAETRIRYGFATQGGLEEIIVGQTFGRAWNTGHALITGEYGSRDALHAEDRPFSQNAEPFNDLIPEQERYSVFVTGGQEFSENVKISSKAYFSRRDSARLSNQPPAIPVSNITSSNEQYGGTLGVAFDLDDSVGNDWRIDVTGGYNRLDSTAKTFEFVTASVTGQSKRKSETISVDGLADGTLFALAGGDVKLAVGAHYREEDFANPVTETKFDRNVKAVFGEVYFPLVGEGNKLPGVEELEISASVRYEDYSDFGSTTDPKFGVKWSPFEGLSLRGTYSTSFRAPLLTELDDSGTVAFLTNGIPNPQGGTNLLVSLIGEGNPNLRPESADIWTGGFDLSPTAIPNLNISASYFNIKYKDRITLPLFQGFTSVLTDPAFAELVSFGAPSAEVQAVIDNAIQVNLTGIPAPFGFPPAADFADADAVLINLLSNLSQTRTTGIDFSASYSIETDEAGIINFNAGGTYLFDFEQQITANAPNEEQVNLIQHPIDFRLNGGVSWNYEGFTANVTFNHTAGYIDNISDPDGVPIDSWTTTNLTLQYNTGDRFGGWLDNTSFTISALNLFDQNPPFVESLRQNSAVNYDPNAANPMGRVLSFNIVKQW